jgi:hypothetical protein
MAADMTEKADLDGRLLISQIIFQWRKYDNLS